MSQQGLPCSDGSPVENVLGWFNGLTTSEAEMRLSNLTLQLHGEETRATGTAVSAFVPLRRWLALEILQGSRRYCLHNGTWYRMDDDNLARIDDRVRQILAHPSPVLPAWPRAEHEDAYNQRAAAIGAIALDRKFIVTYASR